MIHFPQDMGSKYRFITLAAQRCDQLIRGAKPRVESQARKPTTLALQEVLAGVVQTRSAEDVDEAAVAPSPEVAAVEPGLPDPLPAAPLEGEIAPQVRAD
ncbi:MAG: DNA-directed RNA polymerase subunit omega [Acidobacteriota bacterium]|jgi:DNA-directed RNA polymerase omega subunit